MIKRRYAMVKIGSGDYLLPDNDRQTLYRLARDEREGWSVWAFAGDFVFHALLEDVDLSDWSNWNLQEQQLKTRADAIEAALN